MRQIYFFLAVIFSVELSAQDDTAKVISSLPEVDITANRMISFSSSLQEETKDTLLNKSLQQSSLGELLQLQSTAYIKNYGAAGLTTSSIRGASAAHTVIVWNGFNISNPMNGQTDLNLLQAGNNLNWNFYPGGSSAMWGSGAIAGTLSMNSLPAKKNLISVTSEYSTINDLRNSLRYESAGKNVFTSTRFWYNTGKNNFPYVNTSKINSPIEKQTHSSSLSFGIIEDVMISVKENQTLNIHLWMNSSEREIPPSMLEEKSDAVQNDKAIRIAADYNFQWKNNLLIIRSGYFTEKLMYDDSSSDIHSNAEFRKIINEAELRSRIKNSDFWIQSGVQHTMSLALSDGYSSDHQQNIIALFSSLKFVRKKSESSLNIRKEFTEAFDIPFVPSLSSKFLIHPKINLSGSVSRNFRIPTFNDLYWNPGGNINLKPESGWSEETRIEFFPLRKKETLRYSLTAFNRNIDNWIIWLPGNNYWSPENIMNVHSRGFENRIEFNKQIQKITLISVLKYDYIRSTNQSEKRDGDASFGKQLIYVPQDVVNATLSLAGKKSWIGINYHYTGYRFTSTDHTQWLDPFSLINIFAGSKVFLKNSDFEFYARINNLLNENFQAIPWQPLPGRNYTIGLKLNFSLSTHNKNQHQ